MTHSFPTRRSADLVARQAWVEHLGDTVLALQELRHRQRIGAVALDAQLEGLQALHHDPGIERAERRAGVAVEHLQVVLHEGLAAERSDEGRVGKGGVSTCRSRWWRFH